MRSRIAAIVLAFAAGGCGHSVDEMGSDGGSGADLAGGGGGGDGAVSGADLAGGGVLFDITVAIGAEADTTVGAGEPWIGVNKNGFSVVSWTRLQPEQQLSESANVYLASSPLRLGPYGPGTMTPALWNAVGSVDGHDHFHVVAAITNRGIGYSRLDPAGKLEFTQTIDLLDPPGTIPVVAAGPKNEVAIAWTRTYHDPNGAVTATETAIAVSRDEGMNFAATTILPSPMVAYVTAVAWGPDDALHVAITAVDDPPPVAAGAAQHFRAITFLSTDQGITYDAAGALPVDGDSAAHAGIDPTHRAESLVAIDQAQLAVTPGGLLVAVWSGPSGSDLDLFCATSDNGGLSFGAAVQINDDNSPAFHLLPALAVDDAGRIHVEWADGRGSSVGAIAGARYRPMYAISRDGGATFSPSIPLRDLATALHPRPADPSLVPYATWNPLWVGDAWHIATQGDRVFPIWSDTSSGHAQVYLTTGVIEQ